MGDVIHGVLNWADHNRYLAAALLAACVVILMTTACETRTPSPFTGELSTERQILAQAQAEQARLQDATRQAELTYQQALSNIQAQAEAGQINAQAALDEIVQRKQAIEQAMAAIAQLVAGAAGVQYAPMVGSAVGIAGLLLGLGTAADSRRKDQVILRYKAGQSDPSGSAGAMTADQVD